MLAQVGTEAVKALKAVRRVFFFKVSCKSSMLYMSLSSKMFKKDIFSKEL